MSVKKNGLVIDEKVAKVNKKLENEIGEYFEPPDGGWGWIIVLAAGLSNLSIFPTLQSFGLIFKDRFEELGISASQTTTILNINCAVTSCTGLINGPLFRRFSCRQVSFTGALICAVSITVLSSMKNFVGILILFGILFGVGVGIIMSANSLALNTYFKKKRRIATGFSWTCTGLGAIVMPQIVTLLIPTYDVDGTILILGAFSFHTVACALLLQPVSWHVRKKQEKEALNSEKDIQRQQSTTNGKIETEIADKDQENNFKSRSLANIDESTRNSTLAQAKAKFGSQYLYYDDEEDGASGIDVIGPGFPMISRANDGWFSKKNTSSISLASKKSKRENVSRNLSRRQSVNSSSQSSLKGLNKGSSVRTLSRENSEGENYRKNVSSFQPMVAPLTSVSEFCKHGEDTEQCKDPYCSRKLDEKTAIPEQFETDQLIKEESVEETEKKSFLEAVIIFFDLDLLRDPIYVNIMVGLTFATFAEINFSLLTPFILGEYGYSKIRIATVMSILASVDVITRLTIPFIADFIGWQNKTFFLVGIGGLAVGRIVLAHVQDFKITLAVAVLIGVGKALRTIFMALVIPSHVPLSRLAGASGIQLMTSGILSLIVGPFVGYIRDVTSSYSVTLHCLNLMTYFTIISWSLEIYWAKRKSKKACQTQKTLKKQLVV